MHRAWRAQLIFAAFLSIMAFATIGDSANAQGLTIALSRDTDGQGFYTPGTPLTVTLVIASTGTGTLTALGVEDTLPADWTFLRLVAQSGTPPDVAPNAGATGLLEFAWFASTEPTLPELPVIFTYQALPPHGQEGTKAITGRVLYRYLESAGEFESDQALTELDLTGVPQTYYAGGAPSKQQSDAPLGSFENPFPAIGDAVAATRDGRGDTIYVLPGEYAETLSLKRNTSLIGHRGAYRTRIHPGSGDPAITATDGCVIRRFTMTGDAEGTALHIGENADVEATNLVMHSSGTGLWIAPGGRANLFNNTVFGNLDHGVRIEEGATVAQLKHNIFMLNHVGIHSNLDAIETHTYNGYYANAINHLAEILHHETDLFSNPGFVATDELNFHLLPDSPMRDAGDPASEHNDADGSRNDLGADGGPYGVVDTEEATVVILTNPVIPVVGLGGKIVFDGSTSFDEWGIESFVWDFDSLDGFQADSTEPVVERTYTALGTYTVTLRITDYSGISAENTVQVQAVDTSLDVLFPNGGERLPLGRTVEIRWDERIGAAAEDVRITLFREGAAALNLGTVPARAEHFAWTIPPSLALGDGYTVQVQSLGPMAALDASDAPFSIVDANNDSQSAALWIGIDGPPLTDCFHYEGDGGWFQFCAGQADLGREISIVMSDVSPGVDANMVLYASDGQTVAGESGECPAVPASSCISFVPGTAGCFFVYVAQSPGSPDFGTDTCYTISITHPDGLGPIPGAVAGIVRSAFTQGPLPGARVALDFAGLSGNTNMEGVFLFDALPPGTYTVTASVPNFVASSQTVTVAPGASTPVEFVLEGGLPPAGPPNVAASDGAYADRIRVSWSSVPFAGTYTILRDGMVFAEGIRTGAFDDAWPGAGIHVYQVQAQYPGGAGAISEGDSGFLLLEPGAPQDVQASDGQYSDHVRVEWQAAPGAIYYRVYRAQGSAEFDDAELLGDWTMDSYYEDFSAEPVTVGTIFDCGLLKDERYYYWVVSGNAAGESAPGGPDRGSRGGFAETPFGCKALWAGHAGPGAWGDFSLLLVFLAPLALAGSRRRYRALASFLLFAIAALALTGCPETAEFAGAGPAFMKPLEIAVTPAGDLLVVDGRLDAIFSVHPESGLRRIVVANGYGSGPELSAPTDIAALSATVCFVTDAAYPGVLRIDTRSGQRSLMTAEGKADAATPLAYPVAIDGTQDWGYCIADAGVNALFSMDPQSGELALVSGEGTGAGPLWSACDDVCMIGADALFVLSAVDAAVFQVDRATGNRLLVSGLDTGAGPPLLSPRRLAAGPDGTLTVLEHGADALVRIDLVTGARTVLASGAENGALDGIRGLAYNNGNSFYTLDMRRRAVLRVDAAWGDSAVVSCADLLHRAAYAAPGALAPLGGGNWAVLDTELGDVLGARMDGSAPETAFDASAAGLAWGAPVSLATLQDNIVCVLDAYAAGIATVNLSTGAWSYLAGDGPQLQIPIDIAREGGNLFVADFLANAVVRVDPVTGNRAIVSGSGVGEGPSLEAPLCIAGDTSGNLLVAGMAGELYRINIATGNRTLVSGGGTGAGIGFGFIAAVCAAPGGVSYAVVDSELGAIVLVDADTGNRAILSGEDAGAGPLFEQPSAIATDGQAYYVSDAGLSAVLRVDLATGDRVLVSE